ncbi:glucose-1-phosphatase [Myxococcaceae bacterium]|nr:glucose-1-phosphatase [Myxococcaceae bacterium]
MVCWDHAFVREQAASLGFDLEAALLARSEAAARPLLDRLLASGRSTEAPDTISAYLRCMLEAGLARAIPAPERDAFVSALAGALRSPEASDRLWSRVPDGLPDALDRLRTLGLRLVVVSNSDGSIERKLRDAGVADLFDAIIDSARVGAEKPDPAIFLHAVERSGRRADRTLHVGDLHSIDVVGARRAGLRAALVDPHGDWEAADCARFPDATTLARSILAAKEC